MAAAAEAARFTAAGGVGVVLRFGLFYGPDPASLDILARARVGRPVVLGRAGGWLSPVHLDDAATAVVAALGCPAGIYNMGESPVVRMGNCGRSRRRPRSREVLSADYSTDRRASSRAARAVPPGE